MSLVWIRRAALLTTPLLFACGGGEGAGPPPSTAAENAAPFVAVRTRGVRYPGSDCGRRHPGAGPSRASLERRGSTVALARYGGDTLAYVADEDSRAIHVINVDRGERAGKTDLPGAPSQALILADGRVAVAIRDRSSVLVLEPGDDPATPLATLCEVPVAPEAWGLAATPDDARVLVTSGWGASLSILDGSSLAMIRSIPLPREPRAVVAADDGRRAFVSHAIGARVSVVDLDDRQAAPRAVDLGVKAPAKPRENDSARTASQGFALAKAVASADTKQYDEIPGIQGKAPVTHNDRPNAPGSSAAQVAPAPQTSPTAQEAPAAPRPPDPPRTASRDRIFVPMATVDPGNPFERSFEYYGLTQRVDGPQVAEPIVGVIDALRERAMTRDLFARLDGSPKRGCVLPRAAAVSGDSDTLLVACLGIDSVLELDARGADPMRMELRRWKVPEGPTGVAIDPSRPRAIVWSQFAGKVTVLDLAARGRETRGIEVDYSPPRQLQPLLEGRGLFHRTSDRAVSSNGLACASCHPDGRDDGITWSTSTGPRQTLMLAGRMKGTAPYGWRGQQPDLNAYLTHTISRLGGDGLGTAPLAALEAFVKSVPAPPPAPFEDDPDHAVAVARGRELFFGSAQGCSGCHIDGDGTDGQRHDVGSHVLADEGPDFDTPSLHFIRRTGPYFHDGRYATLADLLAAPDSGMGSSAPLSGADRAALEAFLETL